MRLANAAERLVLVSPDGQRSVDVERVSGGRFSSEPQAIFERWQEFALFVHGLSPDWDGEALDRTTLGSPAPSPRQVFAIGLNYRDHASETNSVLPDTPLVFTKFASSLGGPDVDVEHPGGSLDWEVELVVVIGARAHRIPVDDAWSHVAGVTVGQDLSERVLQHRGTPAQFSLGKSYPNFGPMGPWLVTPDELSDPDDLELGCLVNGQLVQKARTSEMVFSVSELLCRLSQVTPLMPGDVIFTGTPAGVGMGATPPRFLAVSDQLVSYVQDVGEIRNTIVAGPLGA
jgi:2-keto-4-pentenoate hydratase/2-oxohepta-3-ene-1,7-dioic acid hydratase in catechol pathway